MCGVRVQARGADAHRAAARGAGVQRVPVREGAGLAVGVPVAQHSDPSVRAAGARAHAGPRVRHVHRATGARSAPHHRPQVRVH